MVPTLKFVIDDGNPDKLPAKLVFAAIKVVIFRGNSDGLPDRCGNTVGDKPSVGLPKTNVVKPLNLPNSPVVNVKPDIVDGLDKTLSPLILICVNALKFIDLNV